MAWDEEMVSDLRILIADLATPPAYSDEQLAQMVLIGAKLARGTMRFRSTYAINTPAESLLPDPTLPSSRDENFITLSVLKAAVVLVGSEIKAYNKQAVRIKEGTSEISLVRDPEEMKLMLLSFTQMYDDALYNAKAGGGTPLGQLVIGMSHRSGGDYRGEAGWTRGWERY